MRRAVATSLAVILCVFSALSACKDRQAAKSAPQVISEDKSDAETHIAQKYALTEDRKSVV